MSAGYYDCIYCMQAQCMSAYIVHNEWDVYTESSILCALTYTSMCGFTSQLKLLICTERKWPQSNWQTVPWACLCACAHMCVDLCCADGLIILWTAGLLVLLRMWQANKD